MSYFFNITIEAKHNLKESNYSDDIISIQNYSSSLLQFSPRTSSSSYSSDINISLMSSGNISLTKCILSSAAHPYSWLSCISGFRALDCFNIPVICLDFKQCSQKTERHGGRTEISQVLFSFLILTLNFSNLALSTDFCFDLYNLRKNFLIWQLFPNLKIFRNVELVIIALKQIVFPLQKMSCDFLKIHGTQSTNQKYLVQYLHQLSQTSFYFFA